MAQVKRVISSDLIHRFLHKAAALAGEGAAVAFILDGRIEAVAGCASSEEFIVDSSKTACANLTFCGKNAQLAVQGHSSEFTPCLEFLVFSLQSILDAELARRAIADEALSKYRELALLHRSVSQFNTSLRLHDVTHSLICECKNGTYPGDKGAVFLRAGDSDSFRLADCFGFNDLSALASIRHCPLFSQVAAKGKGEILSNVLLDERWEQGLVGIQSILLLPLISPNGCEGILLLGAGTEGAFDSRHLKSLSTMGVIGGISISNAFHFESSQTRMDAILQALAEAIDSRDPFTAGHSRRVAQLAAAFAVVINEDQKLFRSTFFSEAEIRELYYSGILHDIGKIGIREAVLTKDSRLPGKLLDIIRLRMQLYGKQTPFDWESAFGKIETINTSMTPAPEQLEYIRYLSTLGWDEGAEHIPLLSKDECACLLLTYGNLTPEEREEIQRHPAESERILQHIPLQQGLANLLTIIRQHHERMDGSGYPDGLQGDEIFLQSRMLAIVDVYDAITQERHYKRAATPEQALNILRLEAKDGKLDADLTAIFVANATRIEQVADTISVQANSPTQNFACISAL